MNETVNRGFTKPVEDMQFLYVLIGPDKKAYDHRFMTISNAESNNEIIKAQGYTWYKVSDN